MIYITILVLHTHVRIVAIRPSTVKKIYTYKIHTHYFGMGVVLSMRKSRYESQYVRVCCVQFVCVCFPFYDKCMK